MDAGSAACSVQTSLLMQLTSNFEMGFFSHGDWTVTTTHHQQMETV